MRAATRLALLITSLVAVVLSGGCGDESGSVAARVETGAAAEPAEFRTAEALRDFLCTLSTAEDRLATFDLIHSDQRVDDATKVWHRSILQARLDYARALNEHLAGEGPPIVPTDLGMPAFVEAIRDAPIERLSPVLVRIPYTLPDGENGELVLERHGTWKINVRTLTGGVDVNDVWFFNQQFRFGAVVQYHRDVTAAVRAGEFASREEADARLAELLAGPPPRLGSVVP